MKDLGGFAPAQIRNLLKKRSLSYGGRTFSKVKPDSTKSKVKAGSGGDSQEDSEGNASGGEGSLSSDEDEQQSSEDGSKGGDDNKKSTIMENIRQT